jgi:hypothetical protein
LGDGVYMVQIIFENEVIIEKLVLSKNWFEVLLEGYKEFI